ncbi:MAG: sigma-54-dependent transcriptional regulator [Candidatus Poribacteria bacterium]
MNNQEITILLIDDEPNKRKQLRLSLEDRLEFPCRVVEAGNRREAYDQFNLHKPDIVLLDMRLEGEPEDVYLVILKWIQQRDPEIPVIIITAYASVNTAIEALREGAYHYFERPVDAKKLQPMLKPLRDLIIARKEIQKLQNQLRGGYDKIIGHSPALLATLRQVEQIAPTNANVLILGETGTGKELIAELIHQQSKRAKMNFVKVNCAAISETMTEAELFGVTKGAATDVTAREGKFGIADGGTIFLDEIGEMALNLQAKLLRAIDYKEIQRLGDDHIRKVDVRIIAATNRDLEKDVERGLFREDLYSRLREIEIRVPPLRERKEDIPLLVKYFIEQLREDSGSPFIEDCTKGALKLLENRDWPDNVRGLKNAVRKACINAHENQTQLYAHNFEFPASDENPQIESSISDDMTLDDICKWLIIKRLKECKGNVTETAKRLGIPRRTLYEHFKNYTIAPESYRMSG